MQTQPVLADSAFASFSDELIAYFTLFLEPQDLLHLSEVNSVFYVFCQEDPLWMTQCLRLHNGNFSYHRSWKLTTFYPRDPRPLEQLDKAFCLLTMKNFGSEFLYRRWYRCHMELGDAFMLHSEEQDPTIHCLQKIDVQDLTFQDFFEQYARKPFVICNAIGKWKASTEWTAEKLTERFSSDLKLRITHNLDVTSSTPTLKMSFADYFQYAKNQHDETPLYIFDEKFGEKMPSLLEDYRVEDLKVFQEDFLGVFTGKQDNGKKAFTKEACVKLEAGGKQVRKNQKLASASIRPDFRWIVIGPQRSGAPWHQDPASTCAWNSLVKGRKRWAIYPPDSPPPGVNIGKNGEYRDTGLDMSSLMWYLHVYPTLTLDQKPLEIIQEEGETIYVPSGWWHLVLNLDLTIAVTQNMVNSHNLVMFMKDMLMDDGRDEALTRFQQELRASRPETFDMFRLVQIPRLNGYLTEEMFQQSFHILEYWKPQLKKVFRRHKMVGSPKSTETRDNILPKVKYPKMKSLTSRVNPTFAIGKQLLVKFFSQYNENWGEFDFETYMTPKFDSIFDRENASLSKRRKYNVLKPYELKNAMSLRYAMEDCFRIERAIYQMIERAAASQTSHQSLKAMVPRLFHSGHLLAVDEVDDSEGEGPMWRWPYIIIEYKSYGISLDSLTKKGGVTPKCWNHVATWISQEFLARLHSIPIDPDFRGLYGHSKAEWDWYIHYLLRQRKRVVSFHLAQKSIPANLMKLLENFLPGANSDAIVSELLPLNPSEVKPVLLHGDLTAENILGLAGNEPQAFELSTFLKSIGCEKYISLLVEQEGLTFESRNLLDEAYLRDLGIPLEPRLAILKKKRLNITYRPFDTDEEEWETSSNSSSSEDEDANDCTTQVGLAAMEAKRKAKFLGSQDWVPTSVIDFADAKTGDPLYDLVAIFFDALHCDRELWKITLASEYWQKYINRENIMSQIPQRRCLQERFLQLVLLHPSHSVKSLFHYFPQAASAGNWEDLARELFDGMFEAALAFDEKPKITP